MARASVTGTGRANPACNGSGGTCKPAYASVMDYAGVREEDRELHLTPDDRKTAQRIYHPSRPTCTLP
jgi:hypothetical protein